MEDQLATLGDQLATLKLWQYVAPLILGAIVSALTYVFIQRKMNKVEKAITLVGNEIKSIEERKNALYGTIVPLDSSTNEMIRVLYGGNTSQTDRKDLAAGCVVPLFDIGITFPLSLKLVGKKLLVDFSFRDLSGALTAEMHENKWQVNKGNFFR